MQQLNPYYRFKLKNIRLFAYNNAIAGYYHLPCVPSCTVRPCGWRVMRFTDKSDCLGIGCPYVQFCNTRYRVLVRVIRCPSSAHQRSEAPGRGCDTRELWDKERSRTRVSGQKTAHGLFREVYDSSTTRQRCVLDTSLSAPACSVAYTSRLPVFLQYRSWYPHLTTPNPQLEHRRSL